MRETATLIDKYNTPGPRYTSYPTVPHWNLLDFSADRWKTSIAIKENSWIAADGVSVYIHLPYCESLCTFCACHKRITKNHSVEESYIDALILEWDMYVSLLGFLPRLKEIHLGGGTPSFFSAKNLGRLIEHIQKNAIVDAEPAFSFEGHPNNTSEEHLQTLYDLGFRRVSFGVQDYDPVVQKAIHRIQPFENVAYVTEAARKIGYTSISHDLVFGLPFQTINSIENTIQKTLELKPERIAFYSYAHVPWIKGTGQRGFDENDLPSGNEKRALYERGLELFQLGGYEEVGMDHFALPNDELFEAKQNKTLHRNFMGYTTQSTKAMIGLGASSISDVWGAFGQNIKDVEAYKNAIFSGELPIEKGHILSEKDLFIRKQILNIMCNMETTWSLKEILNVDQEKLFSKLQDFQDDGLLTFDVNGLQVLETGRPFLRNICMAFDQYLLEEGASKGRLFSQTI